jgi:hypothetical protein
VKAPFNAFNEVLPGFAANAAPYAHLREMVVTHTGLERNCVTHLLYTITTRPGMLPGLMGKVLFGERSPIEELIVRVRVPKNTALRYWSVADSLPPTIADESGSTVYTWIRRNLPLMAVETNQPPMDQALPSLCFTTATVGDLSKHLLRDAERLFAATPAMTALAVSLTRQAATPYDKAMALRNHIEANVALMPGDPMVAGYLPLPAETTFRKNVGSSLDRVVLLAALCRSAGIDARIALAHVNDMASVHSRPAEIMCTNVEKKSIAGERMLLQELPAFHAFAIPVVCCPGLGKGTANLLLDPNSEQFGSASVRTAGKPYLLFPEAALVLPPAGEVRNRISIRNEWTIDDHGNITGSSLFTSNGRGRYSYRDEKDRFVKGIRRAMGRVNGGMTVADEQFKVVEDGTAQCSIRTATQHPLEAVGDVLTIRLPTAPGSFEDAHLVFPSYDRFTAYELPHTDIEQCTSIIKIPAGYTVAAATPPGEESNLVGDITSDVSVTGDELRIHRQFVLYDHMPSAGHYHSARHLFNVWYHPAFTTVTLVRR